MRNLKSIEEGVHVRLRERQKVLDAIERAHLWSRFRADLYRRMYSLRGANHDRRVSRETAEAETRSINEKFKID
jgi:hypothetical protein